MSRKTRIIRILSLFFLVAAAAAVPAYAAGVQLLENGALEGGEIPEGWSVQSFLKAGYAVSAEDGTAALSSSEANDLRLYQTAEVQEESVYLFTCEIRTQGVIGGRGACLSIDNYSIDGTYIYSAGIFGSADWTEVTLAFRTGKGQTQIRPALRLGGYSAMSSGTALFRNVRLELSGQDVPGVIPLSGGETSAANAHASEEMSKARIIQLKSFLHLFIVIAVTAAVILLFGIYRNRERLGARFISREHFWKYFILTAAAGLVLRSILASAWGGHDTDMSCWIGWGGYIAQNGTASFYTAPGHEWYDYPPGYMLVLGLIARLIQLFKVPASSDAAVFAYMLPAAIADIAIALLVMRYARRKGFSDSWRLLLGGVVIFNPAAVMLSGAWGQIDSILTLFLLLAFAEFAEGRRVTAGALYGLAIMVKWQALIYGPVFACAYLLRLRNKRDLLETAGGVAAALAVILLISLPFRGDQGFFWVVGKFLGSAGGYDYASVEAYNFLALCGGNWKNAGAALLPGISYRTFGTFAVIFAVGASVAAQWYASAHPHIVSNDRMLSAVPLFLTAGFCMFVIYTFGHYMHERYAFPVMLLFLVVFTLTREPRFLLCSMALSAVLFLNEMSAMYVISRLASSAVRGTPEHQSVVTACSLAETVVFVYSARVCWQWIFGGPERGDA